MEMKVVAWVCILMAGVVLGASVQRRNCKCVPDQWQGILASLDREFDLRGGRTGAMENNLFISYDYANKMFAMTDLNTGNKAIADYNKGFKYVIRADGCRGMHTNEEMRQMCLPEHAEFMGQFRLGTDIPVDLWQFSGPYNVSMKTTVIQKNCVPITEEVFMSKGNFASLTTSLYLDVNLGIQDKSAFETPIDCTFDTYGPQDHVNQAQEKRNEGMWSLLSMMRKMNLNGN